VLEAVFILLEFPSPSRRIFIGSHSLPPLWFAVSVLHGGVGGAGGRLCDVAAPIAWRRGVVIACFPALPGRRCRAPRAGAGSRRCTAGPLRRGPGRTGAVAKVSRPRRLAQQCTEPGVVDPQRSRMASFSGVYFLPNLKFFPLSIPHSHVS
jgi:hypothetical protein